LFAFGKNFQASGQYEVIPDIIQRDKDEPERRRHGNEDENGEKDVIQSGFSLQFSFS
jgi:hypothetical protein